LKKRVKNIYNNLDKKPDIIIIENSTEPFIDNNFFYITGIQTGLFEESIAILHPDGDIDIIISELEAEIAKKADVNVKVYRNEKDFIDILNSCISSSNTIGLNFNGITHRNYSKLKSRFPGIEFFDVSESFTNIRLVKDEFEINLIKKACQIADKVMEKIPQFLHEGMSEFELAAEIDYSMQKNGASKSAFETISSFGKNTSEPHYSHGAALLKKGDFVLCDFGACFSRYNSDITRTFVFGKASGKQKDMYETVLEAHKIGLDEVKPGLKANKVHEAVNSYIDGTQFKGRFIHSTGHSLGLAVHDGDARFSPSSEIELIENMVFTVEPGVYIPGFGGVRIEDDVLIKKDGIELLTKTPCKIIEI
jgi:Xaa-Pro dipeptidase